MLTTRMSPKISVNPLATTKYSAAAVSPLSSVIRKSFGSLDRGPEARPRRDEEHPDDREDDECEQNCATNVAQRPVCSEPGHAGRPYP